MRSQRTRPFWLRRDNERAGCGKPARSDLLRLEQSTICKPQGRPITCKRAYGEPAYMM